MPPPPPPQALREALELAIGPDNVTADADRYSLNGLGPRLVARPESIEALSRLMAVAWDNDAAVVPWGGGTRTTLGNPIRRLDLAVDLRRLNRVVRHMPADLTATVEAGIALASLQSTLGKQGQLVALDPPLPQRATVGGTLAIGSSGPLKWLYGNPRDVVIGMKVVQPDGTVTKSGGQVVKNVSGYDMARMHIGALGTLGIIAEVSFKLTPLPRNEATIIASFETQTECAEAALAIFHSPVVPLALTTFNRSVQTRIDEPGFDGDHLLAARLAGRPLTVERQVRECTSLCRQRPSSKVQDLDEGAADTLWRRIADFGWHAATRPAMAGRALLKPTKLAEVEAATLEAVPSDGLDVALISHPAHGTMLVHWFAAEADVVGDAGYGLLQAARSTVHGAGGRFMIEQCPTELKSRLDVWDDVGEPVSIMRRMKEQYDPRSILNPGRFVGGI